jgi:hypothetical protein
MCTKVHTTLLKWIELPSNRWLELEVGEDIDVVSDALKNDDPDRVLHAVKHRERNLSLRSPEALAALASFQEHRNANKSLKLGFRYIELVPST